MSGQLAAKADAFRAMHQGPPILVLPNAWDAVSARLFVKAGAKAIATTSAGVAATLGYPDGQKIPRALMLEAIARIARAVNVSVTVSDLLLRRFCLHFTASRRRPRSRGSLTKTTKA